MANIYAINFFMAILIAIAIDTNCQILLRQYINDGQPTARRINIPYLRIIGGHRIGQDSRNEFKEVKVKSVCPECLERRYVQHYLIKGCTPVVKSGCQCPSRYDCSNSQHLLNVSTSVCWHRGRRYKIGERIETGNACRVCECRFDGVDALSADIDCAVQIQCQPQSPAKSSPECYRSYRHDECCSKLECPAESKNSSNKRCTYKGEQYRLGERITAGNIGSDCLSYVCTDHWNDSQPLDSRSCRALDCDLEAEPKLRAGCTPIYHAGYCCPIDYKCPTRSVHIIQGLDSGSLLCTFEGRKYPIDAKLFVDDKCVNCSCLIPPEFTCVHRQNCG